MFDEFLVIRRLQHQVDDALRGFLVVTRREELADEVGALELFLREQEFFPSRTASIQVDGGEDALLGEFLSRWISILPVPLNSS